MMNRVSTLSVLLLKALFILVISQQATAAGKKTVELSGPAKNFNLKSNTGSNISLSELRGQVVMLNFWASWCGPCRQEMPLLDALYQRYNPAGFTLLGVNVETDEAKANKLLKEIPVSFPILYDTTSKVSKQYTVETMPSSVIIDCDGNQRYLHRGYEDGDIKVYKKLVKKLLRECR